MSKKGRAYLIVNFGGPRDLEEVREFLIELLTDQEVIQTALPAIIHRLIFTQVARKRAKKVVHDYAAIGGKSPIYADTESIAAKVGALLGSEVLTFHRYLPKTHAEFIRKIESLPQEQEICVFPLFPQFSYTTTGSIAKWFSSHLSKALLNRLEWVKSYCTDPLYIDAFASVISRVLQEHSLIEEETILLFSAHGLPERYIFQGDVYEKECGKTFEKLSKRFPKALSKLSYQSQFGKEVWIKPYTNEVCAQVGEWGAGYKNVIVVPLSFTSDHIETLFEIEDLYLPILREKGMRALRCPALNLNEDWICAIAEMMKGENSVSNLMLYRK